MAQVCQRCVDHNCDGFCNPSQSHRETVARVQQAIGDNADDLGNSMRLAINDTEEYQDPERAVMAPVNAETFSYYSPAHYEGQGEVGDSDNFMNQSITMKDSLLVPNAVRYTARLCEARHKSTTS